MSKLKEYFDLCDTIKTLNKKKEFLRSELIDNYGIGTFSEDYHRLIIMERKGNIDYKQIVLDNGIYIDEKYRKSPMKYVTVL